MRHAKSALPPPPPVHFTEDDWLANFTAWGKAGEFKGEPDFPRALTLFRDALLTAKASVDPPFDPPEDCRPDEHYQWVRLEYWRTKYRFPELVAALEWLMEMKSRREWGVPPVGEALFRELEAWFRASEPKLTELQKGFQWEMLPIGGGERTTCSSVRYGLMQGPRAEYSGQTADLMRKLRARYREKVEGRGGASS